MSLIRKPVSSSRRRFSDIILFPVPPQQILITQFASSLTTAEVKFVKLCFTLILAQASCVDSVPLSSFTSMEPKYCGKEEHKHAQENIQVRECLVMAVKKNLLIPTRRSGGSVFTDLCCAAKHCSTSIPSGHHKVW